MPTQRKVMSNKERIEILITGTSGVGKSTLINGLAGKRVAKTENELLLVESKKITSYTVNVTPEVSEGGIEAVVWELPGLQDDSETENEDLTELKEKCANFDVILYCMDASATRSSGLTEAEIAQSDLSAINKLTATFGQDWWKRSIIVLTRANVLESALKVKPDLEKRFNDKLQEWRERITATLIATGVPKEVACEIQVEPAGHPKKPRLPGRDNWINALWSTIVLSASMFTTEQNDLLHEEHDFVPQSHNSTSAEGQETAGSEAPSNPQVRQSGSQESRKTTNRTYASVVAQIPPFGTLIPASTNAPTSGLEAPIHPQGGDYEDQGKYDSPAPNNLQGIDSTYEVSKTPDSINPRATGQLEQNPEEPPDGSREPYAEGQGTIDSVERVNPQGNDEGTPDLLFAPSNQKDVKANLETPINPNSNSVAPTSSPISANEPVEILITGTSGVGKSTLVNGLAGKRVAETASELLPMESKVTSYTVNAKEVPEEIEGGIEAVVWDSPGLQDSSETYLTELKEKCANVGIILYCIDVSATRSNGLTAADIAENDLNAIRKFTATFGSDWWKRSIFVLTRANVLESALKVKPDLEGRFNDKLQEWRERITATLIATGVPKEVACGIPVEPAGHPKKRRLPGRDNWIRALWRVIVTLPSTTEQQHVSIPEGVRGEGHVTSVVQQLEKRRGTCESVLPTATAINPKAGLSAREERQKTPDLTVAQQSRESRAISPARTNTERAGPGTSIARGPVSAELEEGVSWRAIHFPDFVVYLKVLKKVQKDAVTQTNPESDLHVLINPPARVSSFRGKPDTLASTTQQDRKSPSKSERKTLPGASANARAGLGATESSVGAKGDNVSWKAVDSVVYLKIYPREVQRETQV